MLHYLFTRDISANKNTNHYMHYLYDSDIGYPCISNFRDSTVLTYFKYDIINGVFGDIIYDKIIPYTLPEKLYIPDFEDVAPSTYVQMILEKLIYENLW